MFLYRRTVVLSLLWIGHHAVSAKVDLECKLVEVDVLTAKTSDVASHACIHNHIAYEVSLADLDCADKIGNTVVLTNIELDGSNSHITITEQSKVKTAGKESVRRRSLAVTQGFRDVLVVRVEYQGRSPQLSSEDLAGRIFGAGSKQVGQSVSEQFRACSFGKLELVPFTGLGVENGVAEVVITTAVSGNNSVLTLQNLVVARARATWRISRLDHLIIVMPDVGLRYSGTAFLAYAYFDSAVSVYNDQWAGRLSGVMHELGHNLGLHHSGQSGNEYGDQSGYMGYASTTIGGPAMCLYVHSAGTIFAILLRSLRAPKQQRTEKLGFRLVRRSSTRNRLS